MSADVKELEANPQIIAECALKSLTGLSPSQQELLFQTKKEQTFTSILTSALQANYDSSDLRVLVELKGVDYVQRATSRLEEKNSRNTHDLGILDLNANLKLILENKVWYHFDGAKGAKVVKVEKSVKEQLKADIFKLKHSAKHLEVKRCFILINLVTPSRPDNLPKSYRQPHAVVLKRTKGDLSRYRSDGLQGVKSVIESFKADFSSIVHLGSDEPIGIDGSGFLDVFCGEIKLK